MSTDVNTQNVQLAARVHPNVAERVDVLARYIGRNRSGFVRFAVAFTDASMTLAELAELELTGALTDEQHAAKQRVIDDLEAMTHEMTPKRLT
jgi:predicted DNA-binding protein